MKLLPILASLFFLLVPRVARADHDARPGVAHGDAGRSGDLLVRGSLGAGALSGCCGSDPFYSANLSLRAGVRLRTRFAVGLDLGYRAFAGDGQQQDAALLVHGQYWFWERAYATLAVGMARVLENAGNGARPMAEYEDGVAAALGVGFEVPLHRNVALTLELTESITRYEDETYHAPTLTAGLTFGARP